MLKKAVGLRFSNCVKTLTQMKAQRHFSLQNPATVESEPEIRQNEEETKNKDSKSDFSLKKSFTLPPELRLILPDFMPEPDWTRRNPVAEKLERLDMLRRRQIIDIPEFYVGSILAVTVSDQFSTKCANRFVGICIARDDRGLRHHMTLRNVVDGHGVEVRYNVYNPLIQKIEVLKLEKRLDEELYYLRDGLPEYSTVPFNMEPISLPPGSPVPVNPIKVKLRPPPWTKKWEIKDFQGIDKESWHLVSVLRKYLYTHTKHKPWEKYDIVENYKKEINKEDQQVIFDDLVEFENKQGEEISGRKTSFLAPFYADRRGTATISKTDRHKKAKKQP